MKIQSWSITLNSFPSEMLFLQINHVIAFYLFQDTNKENVIMEIVSNIKPDNIRYEWDIFKPSNVTDPKLLCPRQMSIVSWQLY